MTWKDLKRIIAEQEQEFDQRQKEEQIRIATLTDRLKDKPFWIENPELHKLEYYATNGNCCFNDCIGRPEKQGRPLKIFDYEMALYHDLLDNPLKANDIKDKHLFILKSTGIGASEFFLRLMAWLCLRNNDLSGSAMILVVGPRIDLAISLMDRMKKLFEPKLNISFSSKETILFLNNVKIECFPSHHIAAARGIPNVSFIFCDETDFFNNVVREQEDVLNTLERYIGKSNPYLVLVSTPNAPGGLCDRMVQQDELTCIYKRRYLDYKYGLDKIYTKEEIEKARASASFNREYCLHFGGVIGNVFSTKDIDRAIEKGKLYHVPSNVNEVNFATQKSMGIDAGFGSSAFGIVITQMQNRQIEILEALEYTRPDFNEVLGEIWQLIRKYGKTIGKIYVDGANPSIIRSLKITLGEDEEYEEEMKDFKSKGLDYERSSNVVIPVNFGTEHKAMLGNCKMLFENAHGDTKGYIAINPKFDKLITSLRTAIEKGEGALDKEQTAYDDIFDAFRLALKMYYFRDKTEMQRKGARVWSDSDNTRDMFARYS